MVGADRVFDQQGRSLLLQRMQAECRRFEMRIDRLDDAAQVAARFEQREEATQIMMMAHAIAAMRSRTRRARKSK